MFYNYKKNYIIFLNKDILNSKRKINLVENINLAIKDSSIVFIKGKNGTGKTQIINKLTCNSTNIDINNNYLGKVLLKWFNINKMYKNIFTFNLYSLFFSKISTFSLGYKNFYLLILNWIIKKKLFLFDEPFNGLDKYFLSEVKNIYFFLHSIRTVQIKAFHNRKKYNKYVLLFLN